MALVEEDAVDCAFNCLIDRRVIENDVRGLSAELESELFARACDRAGNRATDSRGARERHFVDVGMVDQSVARVSSPRDDIDDSCGQVCLLQNFREEQGSQWRGFRWLDHYSVARGERRSDLPREHEQREVPGDNLTGDTERARVRAESRVVEFVRPPCVVEEPRCNERDVDIAAFLDGLAVVEALSHGKFTTALLNEARDAEQVLAPIGSAHTRPGRVVCRAGG